MADGAFDLIRPLAAKVYGIGGHNRAREPNITSDKAG